MKDTKKKYLEKKSLFKMMQPCSDVSHSFPIAVCIPAYNEYPNIIKTLQSLALSSAACSVKIHAIICVNNRENSPIEVKQNNHFLVQMLNRIGENEFFVEESSTCGVKITVLDYTDGKNQFSKGFGVGWARKIAMDYALAFGSEVIACLDADTLVSLDYCSELERFRHEKMDFATMDFSHQDASTPELQDAINCFEFWMKDHSRKLKECGTPFHYMALGSLIVVSSTMYAQIGGMKNRLAGEDFYFIQEAVKILMSRCHSYSQIVEPVPLLNCQVYPEARISERVLFGTGKTLSQVNGGRKQIRFYLDSSYEEVMKFIALFDECNKKGLASDFPSIVLSETGENSSEILSENLSKKVSAFLIQDNFFKNWDKMIQNTCNDELKNALSFHFKFDGLKIIRLIHFLEK